MRKSPNRNPLILSTRIRNLGKSWIYLPGGMLVLLGLSILFFPAATQWILAGFFIGSGALLIHATRVLKKALAAFQQSMSDVYIEQMVEEERHASFEDPGHFLSWVN